MSDQTSLSPRAWAELLLLAGLWGGSYAANRAALDEVPVATAVALRVTGACLILWAYVAVRRLPVPKTARIWSGLLVMGLLNNVLPFALINWGQLSVPSGLAAIVNASTAIFGVVAAALAFRDERLTPRRLAGVALGFAGVATAVGPERLMALDLTALPQVALVAAAVSYACAAVWARRRLSGLAPQVAAAGMLTASTLIALPLALVLDGPPAAMPGAAAVAALAYLAVAATAGAYLLYYRVLAMAGAGNLSLVTLLTAPVAILMGALLFGEALPPRAFLGFALIALGLLAIDGRLLRRTESA